MFTAICICVFPLSKCEASHFSLSKSLIIRRRKVQQQQHRFRFFFPRWKFHEISFGERKRNLVHVQRKCEFFSRAIFIVRTLRRSSSSGNSEFHVREFIFVHGEKFAPRAHTRFIPFHHSRERVQQSPHRARADLQMK